MSTSREDVFASARKVAESLAQRMAAEDIHRLDMPVSPFDGVTCSYSRPELGFVRKYGSITRNPSVSYDAAVATIVHGERIARELARLREFRKSAQSLANRMAACRTGEIALPRRCGFSAVSVRGGELFFTWRSNRFTGRLRGNPSALAEFGRWEHAIERAVRGAERTAARNDAHRRNLVRHGDRLIRSLDS